MADAARTPSDNHDDRPWWEPAVVYQVYPRSFQDADGDGTGDLPGILARLDHLAWLGVDAVWLSPIFPSPMADFGYDVADYRDVDPRFGTLEDLDRLVEAVHRLGMRVLLDFVPNHTSVEHPWFVESRSSRDSPRRDWYLWADPSPDGGPPNNWRSVFGGSAWAWDEATGQYYYHAFLREQPDLNWRNPAVREAMLDVLRFWFGRGIDGVRIDVIWHLAKDERLRDNPPNPDLRDPVRYGALLPVYTTDRPEVLEYVREMRRVADEHGRRLLIGEIYLPVQRLVTYYGTSGDGVHLPFNFQLVTLPWEAPTLARAIDAYERALPPDGWPNWVLGNHDQSRIASRVGRGQARVAAMLLLGLRGTSTIYYGDEIGMTDVPIPPERQVDPARHHDVGRDPQRTPMQWDGRPNAGFTTGEPWLPIPADHRGVNVAAQREDPRSILQLYRRLIALRRTEPALAVGSQAPIETSGTALAFLRVDRGRRLVVALNLGGEPMDIAIPVDGAEVLLSTGLDREGERVGPRVRLRGDEGLILAAR